MHVGYGRVRGHSRTADQEMSREREDCQGTRRRRCIKLEGGLHQVMPSPHRRLHITSYA